MTDRLTVLLHMGADEIAAHPAPDDVALLLGKIDQLTGKCGQLERDLTKTRSDRDNWQEIAVGRLHAATERDRADKRHRLEHERAETLEAENAKLHRQLGVLNSRPDVRQLVATLQRLVAQPTTADAYGDMLAQSIRHVVGRIALGVGVQDAQRGPQRAVADSVMDFPSDASVGAQRPAEGFAVPIRRRTPADRLSYLVGQRNDAAARGIPLELIDGLIADAMRDAEAEAGPIAPEDEGISSADAQAQIESDRYMAATVDCPDCDAYGRTRDEHGLTAQPCPRCKGTGRVPDARNDVLKPEEWCDRYGIRILDPDGWRRADAPDWNERITLDVFHRLLASSTSDAARGGYQRIVADLRAVPVCPDCGHPETNCACG